MEDTALFQQLLEWIQQQKPLYLAMKTATLTATDYVGFMVVQNWPVICSWLIYFGRLLLMLSELWLECSLKGMSSLLHLGSTAYFVLLWCTVLSTTSMAGLFSVVISLGIACVAEPFLGSAPAIIIIAISGATILWMYGSFWITGALITVGGSLLSLNHERLAILITTIYSMYLAKVRTGWVGLVFCMNLAFVSNDILTYLLKSNGKENERNCRSEEDRETESSARNFNNPPGTASSNGQQSKSHKNRPSSESSQTRQSAQTFREFGESSQTGQYAQTFVETVERVNFDNLPRSTSSNGQPSKSHKSRPSGESSQTGQSAQTFGESGDSSRTGQFAQTFGETGERSQTNQSTQTFRKSGESSQTGRSAQTFGESSTARFAEADPSPGDEVLHILHSSDHYATLGLSRYEKIDFVILKREYRKKAMLVHPDKNMGNVMAVESFKKLQSAYEVLSDLDKKNAYDEELRKDELTRSSHQKLQCGAQKNGRYNPFEYEKEVKDIPAESSRIACKKCNKSHKWIHTNRAKCRARWCQDCDDYHQAKDGDGWMELSDRIVFFGTRQKVEMQRAYACIENTIFDVSEWATCQGVNCRPNTHNPSFRVNGTVTEKDVVYRSNRTHKVSSHVSMTTNIDEYMTQEDIFHWLHLHMAFTQFDSVNGLQENTRMKSNYYGWRNLKRNGNNRW